MMWQFELHRSKTERIMKDIHAIKEVHNFAESVERINNLRVKSRIEAPRPRPPGYCSPRHPLG